MVRNKIFISLLASLLLQSFLYAQTGVSSGQTKPTVVANTSLALPADSNVKVRWVCPPLDPKAVDDASWYSLCFTVDATGRPWLGYQEDTIISPVRQYRFELKGKYKSFTCLDNGTFLVANDADLGFVVPPAKLETTYDNLPKALFQPITDLPIPECKLYPGAGNCLYLAGLNKDRESEVYLLRPDKSGIRGFTKVFTSKSDIRSVTGDGDNTFIAIEGLILKVSGVNGEVTKVLAEPDEYILDMAYNPQIGLFYSTNNKLVYTGAKGNIPLMSAPDLKICLRGNSLYVLLSKSLGVLALDNIQDLKRYDRPVKEVPLTESKDVKFTGVRFFEAGKDAPAISDRQYASVFDKNTARYIYCQVDFDNLQYNKKHHKQTVKMDFFREGREEPWETREIPFDFKPEYGGLCGWGSYGSDNPGTFYPGTYIVKTYLNGTKIDESKFTITGEATLHDCAGRQDVAMVSKLIKAGADVNAANDYGITPLMLAVISSNSEIVKLLLDAGADVNAKSKEGATALSFDGESWTDDATITKLLLAAGADPNVQDKDGKTLLHKAVNSGRLSVVSLLAGRKVNTNIKDKDENTPLLCIGYLTADDKVAAMMEQLVKSGADVNAKDKEGKTALFVAIDRHLPMTVSALVKLGADVNLTAKQYTIEYSVLGYALYILNIYNDYRFDRVKIKQIINILQENGADFNVSEFKTVYFNGIDKVLDFKHMVRLLEMSEAAASNMQPDDPALRKAVIKGLLNTASRKITSATDEYEYYSVLNILEDANNRARKWGLSSSCPEITFNIGITWMCIGQNGNATKFLQEYLDIAPTGSCAARAREIIRQLK